MRTSLIALVSGAGLLFSAAAMAGEQTKIASSDTLICHVMVHEGMVVTHARECHTQQYWDRVRERQQQELRNWQNRGAQP